jgi:DTW domain-containing protein YfiP
MADGAAGGDALYERIASEHLRRREEKCRHRCRTCWHDARACICAHLPALRLQVRVRLLVLMHQKEYLGAGDDAKLLITMLPADQTRLFVYGRSDDWAALAAELADDPSHTMLLWPGEGALTLGQFLCPSRLDGGVGSPNLPWMLRPRSEG